MVGATRFKLALIYAAVGLAVGGFHQPDSTTAWALLAFSLLLSTGVGVARGRLTTLSVDDDGRVYSQGTALTIGLFIGLVVAKFALGAYLYLHGISSHGGFGEVLLMIAVMIAFQAELIWRRAGALQARGATRRDAVRRRGGDRRRAPVKALLFCGLLLLAAGSTRAAPAATPLYEWIDDRGFTRIADAVPDRYRSVAKRTDCAAWRRRFATSRDCFAGYALPDGSLRPGAVQACGPDLPNPEPVCGPENWN